MLRGILRKRDIVLISLMICIGIGFFIFGWLVPRQRKHPEEKSVAIEPKTVQPSTPQRSPSFTLSHKVKQETSLSTSQAEEMERDDEVFESNQDITERQIEENALPFSAEDASANVLASDEEQTETEEAYPVGDLQRLTPQERIHFQQLLEEIRALNKDRGTWVNSQIPLEEYIARDEAYGKRIRIIAGQIFYYNKKLGYKPVPPDEGWPFIIDPHVDGDLAQK